MSAEPGSAGSQTLVPTIEFDQMLRITSSNAAANALFGTDAVGQTLGALLPTDARAALDDGLSRAARGPGGAAITVGLRGASTLIITATSPTRTVGWFVDAPLPAATKAKSDRVAPATERAIADRVSAIVSNLRTPTAQVVQEIEHAREKLEAGEADVALILADARRAARRLQDVLDQYGRLQGSAPEVRGQVAGARVLVVDDDRDIRTGIARRLRKKHEVHEAASGHEAIRLIELDTRWDLILCDLRMPDGTGGDVIQWLDRHQPELLGRFVLLTADAYVAKELLGTSSGREVLALTKPILPDQVDGLIQRFDAGH